MFNTTPSSTFFEALIMVLCVYYLFILIRYFRKEIRGVFSRKKKEQKTPAKPDEK